MEAFVQEFVFYLKWKQHFSHNCILILSMDVASIGRVSGMLLQAKCQLSEPTRDRKWGGTRAKTKWSVKVHIVHSISVGNDGQSLGTSFVPVAISYGADITAGLCRHHDGMLDDNLLWIFQSSDFDLKCFKHTCGALRRSSYFVMPHRKRLGMLKGLHSAIEFCNLDPEEISYSQ